MRTLRITDLPDEVLERLRERAADNGRSLEAEAREILLRACSPEDVSATVRDLQAFVDKLYGGNKPKGVVDELIAERRREAAREASE